MIEKRKNTTVLKQTIELFEKKLENIEIENVDKSLHFVFF
jgi:hypothetical protein